MKPQSSVMPANEGAAQVTQASQQLQILPRTKVEVQWQGWEASKVLP